MLPKKILRKIVDDDLQLEYRSANILQQNLAEARNNVKSALYKNPDNVYNARLSKVLDKYLDKLPEKTKEDFPVDEIYEHGARQGKRILSESANIPGDDPFHGWMPVLPINAISAERARMADLIQQVSEDLKTKILRATQVGLAQGNTPQQTIDAILGTGLRGMQGRDGIWRTATHRAETIGRTVSNELINKGALQTYRQVGKKSPDLGLRKVWQSVSDRRTSNICRALDGQIVEMDEYFSGAGWTGEIPPAHPNCRSRITTRPAKNWDKDKEKGKYEQSNTPSYTNPKRVPPKGISVFKLREYHKLRDEYNGTSTTYEEFLEQSGFNQYIIERNKEKYSDELKIIHKLDEKLDEKIEATKKKLERNKYKDAQVNEYRITLEKTNPKARELRDKILEESDASLNDTPAIDYSTNDVKLDNKFIEKSLDQLPERQRKLIKRYISSSNQNYVTVDFKPDNHVLDDEDKLDNYAEDLSKKLKLINYMRRDSFKSAIKGRKNNVARFFKPWTTSKFKRADGYTIWWQQTNVVMLRNKDIKGDYQGLKASESVADTLRKRGSHKDWSINDKSNNTNSIIGTLLHETGHQVHYRAQNKYNSLRNNELKNRGEFDAVSSYGDTNNEEFHAELFAAWAQNPDALKREYPDQYHHIENLMAEALYDVEKRDPYLP